MISRRNIRIKVMQAFYASQIKEGRIIDTEDFREAALEPYEFLLNSFLETVDHFVVFWVNFFLYLHRRKQHILAEDIEKQHFNRMYNSDFFQSFIITDFYKYSNKKVMNKIDPEWTGKIYKRFASKLLEQKAYRAYMLGKTTSTEPMLIAHLWVELLEPSLEWKEYVEEYIPYADSDDGILGSITEPIFSLSKEDPKQIIPLDKRAFGIDIIKVVTEKSDVIADLLKEKILHWDRNRLIQIDNLLLQMGVAELLFFKDIPHKVSINEYVDIAKMYSGRDAGTFVNGILDAVSQQA